MFMFVLTTLAFAERPTEGGLFAYDATDTVETYDEGMIRVHYSSSGGNVTIMDDLDGSGTPDYVELVAILQMTCWSSMQTWVFCILCLRVMWG